MNKETLTNRLWTRAFEEFGFSHVAALANARVERESFEATEEGVPVQQSHQWFGEDEEVLATYVDPEFAISLCGEGVTYLYSYLDMNDSFFASATEEVLDLRLKEGA
mgnify:CR=1 FL=1